MTYSKVPQFFITSALILTLIVIAVGSYTRLKDAGLGCPDWPGCYGQIGAPKTDAAKNKAAALYPQQPVEVKKAQIEMLHRYIAGSLGLLIFALLPLSFVYRQQMQGLPRKISAVLLLVVIFQALLGKWTVTLKLFPPVVMGHLLGGFTLLACLWLLFLTQKPKAHAMVTKAPTKLLAFSIVALIFLALQIALGGWTSSNYAALICPDFPYCQGQLLPELDIKTAFTAPFTLGPNYLGGVLDGTSRITIHMLHRFGAIAATLMLMTTIVLLLGRYKHLQLEKLALILSSLLVTQIGLGILNITKFLPTAIAVGHTVVAAMLLLTLITIIYSIFCFCRER